ncbi:MAG: phosphoribosylanthranilate isomerase [Methylococcales bacterium]|nr:phosphoribosylanthranilate isomerase [Methylococcales bacterium]
MRTRVKMCGFTTVDEAVYAANLGVDAIGLVFYPPSPRNVSLEQAAKIVAALPAFTSVVALFVDESEARINQVLNQVTIDCIQFHGQETPDKCRLYDKPYIKAISMRETTDVNQVTVDYQDASALLLDAYHPQTKGGIGERFDWDLIPKQANLPLILAGGLTPENAQHAIVSVKPYALDVSSGIEIKKGCKARSKMAAFIREVNQGNQT